MKRPEISDGSAIPIDVESGEIIPILGSVSRNLKSRHIQFIALGGTIGTGLFLGIGRALTQAGPLSLLIGYSVTGVAVYGMVRANNVPQWSMTDSLLRCNLWAKWLRGFPYQAQYLNFVHAMWMTPWVSLLDGMYVMVSLFNHFC